MKFELKHYSFHPSKRLWKCRLQNVGHIAEVCVLKEIFEFEKWLITCLFVSVHCEQVTLLCTTLNQITIGSGNGLSLVRHQAITWTNPDWLLLGTRMNKLQWNCNQNTEQKYHENDIEKSFSKCNFVQASKYPYIWRPEQNYICPQCTIL